MPRAAHGILLAAIATLLTALSSLAAERTVIVAQDGTGAFKTVTEALDSVKDATKENPVTLLIKPGSYNEMVTTRNWVNLVGEDRDKCVLSYSRKPAEEVTRTHVIWATTTSTIKNLTLLGGDVKYCIHSDGGGPYVLTVDNCILRRTPPANDYNTAFGIGLWAGQHIVIKDSLLEAKQPLYMHNGKGQESSCSMTVEHCALKGETDAILISAMDSQQRDFFVIHDSTLAGKRQVACLANEKPDKSNFIEFYGSGNTPEGGITGAVWYDDAQAPASGQELTAKLGTRNPLARPGIRIKETYGAAEGAAKKSAAWEAYRNVYVAGAEMTDEGLVLISETDNAFGMVMGPYGATSELPMVMEFRMKCSFAPKGAIGLLYLCKPSAWQVQWQADGVADGVNPAAVIKINTQEWQTYRLVARSADDVKFFVVGRETEAIALKRAKDELRGFKLLLYGKGTKAVLGSTMLTGDVP